INSPAYNSPGTMKLQSSNCSVRWMTHKCRSKWNCSGCQYWVHIQRGYCRSDLSITVHEERLPPRG
ncbi:unnamed protein product, partial [Bubo scandiacus]